MRICGFFSIGELFEGQAGDRSKCTHHECTCTCMSLGALDNHGLELLFNVVRFAVENG